MWIIGLVALVVSIVALVRLQDCRDGIKKQQARIDHIAQEVRRLTESSASADKEVVSPQSAKIPGKPPPVADQERGHEVTVTEQIDDPVLIPESPVVQAEEAPPAGVESKFPGPAAPTAPKDHPPLKAARSLLLHTDRQQWAKL